MQTAENVSWRERIPWPGQGVDRVPYGIYTDVDVYAEEQQRIFRGPIWSFIGMELEVPNPGDFKTCYIGDTPVVLVRAEDGEINVLVNQCGHRGNLVCIENCGNAEHFTCVYHNWLYDLKGNLTSVAFRKGVNNKGGMPDDFDMADHGMKRLRCTCYCGLVFATFSDEVAPLHDFLGPDARENMERVVGRKMRLLGTYGQTMPNNWKLYMENVRDSYHASLLHMFQAAFRINRLTMDGGVKLSEGGWNHISYSKQATDTGDDPYKNKNLHAMDDGFQLNDTSITNRWQEFPCGTTLAIQTIFPNFVVQQIYNSIALRACVPKGPNDCELVWWVLGTEDDTPDQHEMRIKQSNMIGPGGLISMEDGVVGGWVQRATLRDEGGTSVLEMGGRDVEPSEGSRATEVSIRGFWNGWRSRWRSRVPMDNGEARKRIEDLIYDYAHCIDDDRLEEWPDFFTEDCLYKVISRDDYARDMPVGIMTCTSRGMLQDRILSLRGANIYEPHYYRHLISSIRIGGEDDGVWSVQSSYAVIRTMQEGDISVFSSGKFLDSIVEQDGVLRFRERIVVFDSRRVDTLMVIPI